MASSNVQAVCLFVSWFVSATLAANISCKYKHPTVFQRWLSFSPSNIWLEEMLGTIETVADLSYAWHALAGYKEAVVEG